MLAAGDLVIYLIPVIAFLCICYPQLCDRNNRLHQ